MKVLVATQKPFSAQARDGIREIVEKAGHKFALLEKYTDEAELKKAVADAHALIVRSDQVTDEIIEAAHKLKIVVRAGAGYDNIDLEACSKHNVVAMNTPGQNANAVAELAIALMIFMARTQFTPATGTELSGKTIGIQAFGNVGHLVGAKAAALGMKVKACDPFLSREAIEAAGAEYVADVKELYATCDYVSIHIPAVASTIRSIGYDLITSMPKGATLINTARREVIDEDGLFLALRERTDLKYATDIAPQSIERLVQDYGYRVFATPHKMGAQTAEANANAGFAAANQIVDFFATGNRKFQLNHLDD